MDANFCLISILDEACRKDTILAPMSDDDHYVGGCMNYEVRVLPYNFFGMYAHDFAHSCVSCGCMMYIWQVTVTVSFAFQ